MLFIEKFRKFSLYFNSNNQYFEKSKSEIDDYDIEYEKFIDQSVLYNIVDKNLIPVKSKDVYGNYEYLNSLIISYAIAHFQRYIRRKNSDSYRRVINSINFLISNSYQTNEYALLKSYNKKSKTFDGVSSAMDNGMAISLIIRVYKINKDKKLIDFCNKLVNAFFIPVDKGGFTIFLKEKSYWYDEFPSSNKRVLNGKLFALMGLLDYKDFTLNKNVDELIDKGVRGLFELLNLFDKKWWSNYFIGPYSYISSAKYHSLHVLQLDIVGNKLGSIEIREFANKFNGYNTTYNRLFSGFVLLFDKLKLKFLK